MNKLRFVATSLLILSLVIFVVAGRHPGIAQVELSPQSEFVPDEVLVKFKKGTPRILVQYGVEMVQGRIKTYLGAEVSTLDWSPDICNQRSFFADPDLIHIKVPDSIGVEQAIYILSLNPNVEYAERNYIGRFVQTFPNEPEFWRLWAMNNTGQTGGTYDADIDAPEAWSIHHGSTSIVVAVIDSGIDYNHVDLQTQIFVHPGEIPGNGVDDDGNGFIDDWHGWNFVNGNNNPMDTYSPYYHGTHVAGTIGAKGNNNTGVVGVCWDVKLMALKITPNVATAVNAIDYSTYNGAHISNNSYVIAESSSLLAAIDRARTNGKLFVAAAGNNDDNNDIHPKYPASYDLDNIISVLATDYNDLRSPNSNWGPYSVDVGAPGGTDAWPSQATRNIYSTKYNNAYQYLSGTSMASPHVAGLAALIWAHRPSLNWWQVKNLIMKGVDPKASLDNIISTEGRINAYGSLSRPTPNLPAPPTNLQGQGFDCDIRLTWTDNSGNESGFEIYRKSGYVFSLIDTVGPNVTTYWDYELLPGTYYYHVRAYNQYGNSQKTLQVGVKAYQCQ